VTSQLFIRSCLPCRS